MTRHALAREVAGDRARAFLRWVWERKLILVAVAGFVAFRLVQFSSLKAIPEPLYGGDSYQQLGIVLHIYDGHAPWTDSMFPGEFAFRDWMSYLLVAWAARLLSIAPETAFLYSPIVVMALGGLCVYGIGRRTLRDERLAVLLGVAWMGAATLLPTSRYFAATFAVPLFVYALVRMRETLPSRLAAGLAYGFASLSYIVAFFGISLALLLVFAYRALGSPAPDVSTGKLRLRGFDPSWLRLGREVRRFLPVAAVGVSVALLLWGPILLVYHGDVKNPSHLYGDEARGWGVARSLFEVLRLFLDGSHPVSFALGLLAAVGVFVAIAQWESHGGKWALLLLAVGLVGTYHFVVTMPLLQNHLVYYRFPTVFLHLARALLAFQALAFLSERLRTRRRKTGYLGLTGEARPRAFAAGAALVLLAASFAGAEAGYSPQWLEVAKLRPSGIVHVEEGARWVRENAPRDAVFLAHPEASFTLNALTGAKLVVERRSHANGFVDMDQRFADAVVMLFGQNRTRSEELLDAYGVRYFYQDPRWGHFLAESPWATSPAHADEWRENGVPFVHARLPYDPVGDVQLFDVIVFNGTALGPAITEGFEEAYRLERDGRSFTLFERR